MFNMENIVDTSIIEEENQRKEFARIVRDYSINDLIDMGVIDMEDIYIKYNEEMPEHIIDKMVSVLDIDEAITAGFIHPDIIENAELT